VSTTKTTAWFRPTVIVPVLAALFLAACSGSEPTRFYTLSGFADTQTTTTAPIRSDAIGVGPVSLPRYLDRPQIVSRDGPYRIQLAEFDSWGEPLEDLVPRVLAQNLSTLLATENIVILPRRRQGGVETRVEVEVVRFDFEPESSAVLIARWEVYRGGSDTPSHVDTATIREPLSNTTDGDSPDYESAVAAMSGALATLSRQIAAAL
jgi:uncharacterized lipoprotein YmbA